ncbi:MAG: DapH/DapD/GlmU-related protein [Acidobacteriota bacterium]
MTERGASGTPPRRVDPAALPASCRVGSGSRIFAGDLQVGEDVVIGDNVTLVGDRVVLGSGVTIDSGCDLRAGVLEIGERSEIAPDVQVLVAESFLLGMAARVSSRVRILCRDFSAGRLYYMGDEACVGYGGTTTSTARVKIGHHVTIGQHSILNSNHLIEIGDDVGTGSYLALWTHGYHFGHGPLEGIEPAYAAIRVERNAWLGFQVTLLPGVTVGENSILAAGSVVTRSIPPNVLAAGAPAKVKKELGDQSVRGAEAVEAVARVLRAWQRELEWKGCSVTGDFERPEGAEITVRLADGSGSTRVVLLADGQGVPERQADAETLVLVTVDERPEIGALADASTSVFHLRAGRLRGARTPVVEDLRDQFRRYAMPCGDDRTFSSIEPQPFARLRAVTSGG